MVRGKRAITYFESMLPGASIYHLFKITHAIFHMINIYFYIDVDVDREGT